MCVCVCEPRITYEMCQPVKANLFLSISKASIGFSFDHMLSMLDSRNGDADDDDVDGVVFGDIFVKAISKK